jgi:hypothetical protein
MIWLHFQFSINKRLLPVQKSPHQSSFGTGGMPSCCRNAP